MMLNNILNNDLLTILVLFINLCATISYLLIINNIKAKNRFYKLPVIIQKIYVLMFVMPLFVSPFISKEHFNGGFIIKSGGIILTLTGMIFILFSFFRIGIIPSISKSGLITTGMYKFVRHPIYSGTLLLFLGLILFNLSLLSLIYFPVSVLLYYLMTCYEEKDLSRIFGRDYIDYKQKVKYRILPFIL